MVYVLLIMTVKQVFTQVCEFELPSNQSILYRWIFNVFAVYVQCVQDKDVYQGVSETKRDTDLPLTCKAIFLTI